MPSEPDAASETVAEAEIEADRCAHSRVDIEKLIIKHVQKGGVVTIDADGVIMLKLNEKGYNKESGGSIARVEAMVEALRGGGQGTQVSPTRAESAKKRRDRARNTRENYLARQERRREERQRKTRADATIATEATVEATVMTVEFTGETVDEKAAVKATNVTTNEEGTLVATERTALLASPGKRQAVELQKPCTTASEENEAVQPRMEIKMLELGTSKTKRGLEIVAPASDKGKRRAAEPLAGKATTVNKTKIYSEYMYKSKGIMRSKSKGEATDYAKTVCKALSRGERMLAAARV